MKTDREIGPRFYLSDERCVVCGDYVPEGRMVCPTCEKKAFWEEKPSQSARGTGALAGRKGIFGLRMRAPKKQNSPLQ